ncbi:hypothetical protein [Leptothoe spongobia]|uniref:UPF0367 protein IXB50_16070 n=1 Tax=Leptothoe spongobia TAU-MAC 1115 TaxID=1967444 RepID=A0A947GQA3_9CYAN|nr:hypothetical protein [Leptothoe spongobia]MBT9316946.1 hypothetical protein [Leptothoe spongobia TAU-MAC 1115]
MYIVELSLKHTALPMSVQKKTLEAAEEAYAKVLNALKTGQPVLFELTCDKQEGKKLSVLVSELAAVQVYEKSGGASSSGKSAGFFAMAND